VSHLWYADLSTTVPYSIRTAPFRLQTLQAHSTPISALDFSEPYGTLVSAALDDPHPHVWDLLTGEELGRLRGHGDTVKCLQVEDHVCLTGGADGTVRLWDLRRVGEEDEDVDEWEREGTVLSLSDVAEEEGEDGEGGMGEFGEVVKRSSGKAGRAKSSRAGSERSESGGPCVRVLEGHTKAVTSLYFEDDCLVSVLMILSICRGELNERAYAPIGDRRVR
jgi:mitochondrial division protein 1